MVCYNYGSSSNLFLQSWTKSKMKKQNRSKKKNVRSYAELCQVYFQKQMNSSHVSLNKL